MEDMIQIEVVKRVIVKVSRQEVDQARKDNRGLLTVGILKRDANVMYILANNKALNMIQSLDPEVKTITSMDNQVDIKE